MKRISAYGALFRFIGRNVSAATESPPAVIAPKETFAGVMGGVEG